MEAVNRNRKKSCISFLTPFSSNLRTDQCNPMPACCPRPVVVSFVQIVLAVDCVDVWPFAFGHFAAHKCSCLVHTNLHTSFLCMGAKATIQSFWSQHSSLQQTVGSTNWLITRWASLTGTMQVGAQRVRNDGQILGALPFRQTSLTPKFA